MSITHPTTVRNAMADLVVDRIDLGSTNAAGKIRVLDASTVTLVDIDLDSPPAFGGASGGVATSSNPPHQGTASTSGTPTDFQVLDRDDGIVFSGAVTATGGGGDMQLTSTTITENDLVRINTFTYAAST